MTVSKNNSNLINKKSANTKKANINAIILCCIACCLFSVVWAILYYFFTLPPCLIPAQFLCGYLLLNKCKKPYLKIILPSVMCLVFNYLAIYFAVLIGIYAEVGNFKLALQNFTLLFTNSPMFKSNFLLECCYIVGITLACICLAILVKAIIKTKNKPKTISAKKLESNIATDCFIQLFLATKNAISKFLESKNTLAFKKEIYNIEQQVLSLSKKSISEIKQRIADSNSFSGLSNENKKTLNLLKKIVDKY